jgi:hypothetical protein
VINLLTTRNDIWEYLWRNRITVKVFIEIPSEGLNRGGGEEEKEPG